MAKYRDGCGKVHSLQSQCNNCSAGAKQTPPPRNSPVRELVEYIARSLASKPEEVRVTETVEDGRVVLQLEVAPDDKGKIIGRDGRVAQAIRVLLRVAAVKEGTRAILEIV